MVGYKGEETRGRQPEPKSDYHRNIGKKRKKDFKLIAKANKATWANTDTEGNTNTANRQPEMEQNQANYGRSQMRLHHKGLGQI